MKKVALLGHGVVGAAVAGLLTNESEYIEKQIGEQICLKKILDIREFDNLPYSNLFTKLFSEILEDDEITVVCEAMGGLNPAYEYTKELLLRGKSVVTSNKELVSIYGAELLQIAKERDCNYFFEASVGGGIPILHPIRQCFGSNKIEWIQGILNGTTNFIMTQMIECGISFEEALLEAQKNGYAEKDPTDDIEGNDACRKICILASMICSKHICPNQVYCQGISNITVADAAYVANWGGSIKLVAVVKQPDIGKLSMMVAPAIIPRKSLLSGVNGVFNAVLVKGSAVDEVLFVGRGAGGAPTASAMVSDIIEAARLSHTDKTQPVWKEINESIVSDYQDESRRFYLRISGRGDLKDYVCENFLNPEFLTNKDAPLDEAAFITEFITEREMDRKCEALIKSGINLLSKIRVLQENEGKSDD